MKMINILGGVFALVLIGIWGVMYMTYDKIDRYEEALSIMKARPQLSGAQLELARNLQQTALIRKTTLASVIKDMNKKFSYGCSIGAPSDCVFSKNLKGLSQSIEEQK